MGYLSRFSGPKIDELLLKAWDIVNSANGWLKLLSTPEIPTDLNTIISCGNYTTPHWVNGPPIDLLGPINFTILELDNGRKFQMVEYFNDLYVRMYKPELPEQWGKWLYKQANTQVSVSENAPENPDEFTMWLDIHYPVSPAMYVWFDGAWRAVKPVGAMDLSVYDPRGIATDIFKYIDDAIANANIEAITLDFENHINDSSIHVTQADKDSWNAKPTVDIVNEKWDALETRVADDVITQARNITALVVRLQNAVDTYQDLLAEHVADKVIHPSMEKQAYWDSKADFNHTHYLDNRVTIDASQVVSGIIDPARIDPASKEVVVKCETFDDASKVTKEQAQNGDMLWVKEGNIIYYVIDDTLLNTPQWQRGVKVYSAGVVVLDWENITNTPDTLGGYGIVDCYTKAEIDGMLIPLQKVIDDYSEVIDALIDFAGMDSATLMNRVIQTSLKQDVILDTHSQLEANMEVVIRNALRLEELLC